MKSTVVLPTVKTIGCMLLVTVVLVSCTRTIPVELDTYEENVVIEGLLHPGDEPKIYLNRTVPFFDRDNSPSELFIRRAELMISSVHGTDVLRADSTYSEFWCRWEPFYVGSTPIRENTEYNLEVRVGNRTFTAGTVTDVPAVEIQNVDYTTHFVDIYGGHEGVIVDFDDIPGQPNQYRFRHDRIIDNRHETVDDWEYSSTCMADGDTTLIVEYGRFIYYDTHVDGAPVRFVAEPAYINFKGDPGWVYVQSLDRDVADYYDALDRQRESNINPFIEPVFLDSQIEGAIGVFGAVRNSEPVYFEFPLDSD